MSMALLLWCTGGPSKIALKKRSTDDNLVRMTRKSKSDAPKTLNTGGAKTGAGRKPSQSSGRWRLQDATARFSELVRRVKSEGPQHVTVHGREEVVVVSASEYRRLKGELTGQVLIDALEASPHRDSDIAPARHRAPVRDVIV